MRGEALGTPEKQGRPTYVFQLDNAPIHGLRQSGRFDERKVGRIHRVGQSWKPSNGAGELQKLVGAWRRHYWSVDGEVQRDLRKLSRLIEAHTKGPDNLPHNTGFAINLMVGSRRKPKVKSRRRLHHDGVHRGGQTSSSRSVVSRLAGDCRDPRAEIPTDGSTRATMRRSDVGRARKFFFAGAERVERLAMWDQR